LVQLIVEDGGERRGFKVGEGVLTVGTGADASLRLDAPDVAAVHADLEIRDGVATLRPRAGVLPPVIGGTPVAGAVELRHEEPVVIGGARLTVLYPDGVGPSRAALPARLPGAAGGPAPGAGVPGRESPGRGAPGRAVRGAGGAAQRARLRRRKNRGALVSLVVFAVVLALIAGFVFFVGPKFMGTTAKEFEPGARMGAARREATRGNYEAALAELDSIPPELLTPTLAAQVAEVRGEIEERVAVRARDVHNTAGNAWWRENLDKFEKFHLRGTPEPGAVRFFLERLDFFAREWPEHPELPWVQRMQERYATVASLEDPRSFTDLAFEVRLLTTEADPKDWAGALASIDAFLRRPSDKDKPAAVHLREATLAARQEWFDDKLAQARLDYEQGREGQSFAWLVRLAAHVGEADMAGRAAAQLLRFPDLLSRLRGYRTHEPEEFERLAEIPAVARYLGEHPLD